MPLFKRIAPAEGAKYFFKRGQMDISEYVAYLAPLKSGSVGELAPGEGETSRAVQRRLTMAAKQIDKSLEYGVRTAEGAVIFRVK